MENTPQTAGVACVRLQRGRPGLLVHTLPCSTRAHAQTRPDVGLREQGPACGSGRCCGATRVCPRACMCVHHEAQAEALWGPAAHQRGRRGLLGPVQAGALSWRRPPVGRQVWGRGARPAQAMATPGVALEGAALGCSPHPRVWSPAVHLPRAGLCTRSGAVARGHCSHGEGSPGSSSSRGLGAASRLCPEPSGAAGPRGSGRQQLALQPSAAGPLCTGRRAPGPAISRASPPSTRRCSSRCSPRPGEASVGERPGS